MKQKQETILKFSSKNCIMCGKIAVNQKIGLCHSCMMGVKNELR